MRRCKVSEIWLPNAARLALKEDGAICSARSNVSVCGREGKSTVHAEWVCAKVDLVIDSLQLPFQVTLTSIVLRTQPHPTLLSPQAILNRLCIAIDQQMHSHGRVSRPEQAPNI